MKNPTTILDIANWKNEIELPQVQRGFVWRPFQIENLWDSLLRGYPVGSFIFSNVPKSKGLPALLDGQQRATSISLAFQDPHTEGEVFNAKNLLLFLDLQKPSKNDNRRFIFRVITKSHPWGYGREDNRKTLDRGNIEKAKEAFKLKSTEKFYQKELCGFWPFDAGLPVPFYYFLHAVENKLGAEWVAKELRVWFGEFKETKHLHTHEAQLLQLEQCLTGSKEETEGAFYPVAYIYEQLSLMVERPLPLAFLDYIAPDTDHLNTNAESSELALSEEDDREEEMDEIENLFVRLNSAGTPLRGEELNYSVLKSVLERDVQNEIENRCKGFINPARFITIAFRLHQHISQAHNPSFLMRIKPKDFQKAVREDCIESFKKCIVDDLLDLLDKTKALLTFDPYDKRRDYCLPPYLISKLCDSAPEVIFMLMYRLYVKKDVIEIGTPIHKRMLGMVTLFAWFGKGSKLKNHEPLIRNISQSMRSHDTDKFWSYITVNNARKKHGDQSVLFPILSGKVRRRVKDIIASNASVVSNGSFDNIKDGNLSFYWKAFFEKSLLVYAQREYFHESFPVEVMTLDDTNVPFDWDHISPQSLIKRIGVSKAIKDWYSSNGNFRAISFSENRSKSDNNPSEYLQADTSMRFYFCKFRDWKKHNFSRDDIRKTENQKTIYELIMERNVEIYMHWYDTLGIDELLHQEDAHTVVAPLWEMFDQSKWKYKKNELIMFFPFNDAGDELYFAFYDEEDGVLADESAEFGIMSLEKKNLSQSLSRDHKIVKNHDWFFVRRLSTIDSGDPEFFLNFIKEYIGFITLTFSKDFAEKAIGELKLSLKPEVLAKIESQEIAEKAAS